MMARLDQRDAAAEAFLRRNAPEQNIKGDAEHAFSRFRKDDKWRAAGPRLVTEHLMAVQHLQQSQFLVRSASQARCN